MKYIFTIALALIALFNPNTASASDPIYTSFFSNKAVGGYDTVSYFTEGKPVKGSDSYKTKWKGAEWLFSSADNLEKFKNNPEKYAPQYGGYCAWAAAHGSLASGDPKIWHIHDGKLYLNYDQSIADKWLPNKKQLIADADKKFPHLIQ